MVNGIEFVLLISVKDSWKKKKCKNSTVKCISREGVLVTLHNPLNSQHFSKGYLFVLFLWYKVLLVQRTFFLQKTGTGDVNVEKTKETSFAKGQ